MVLFLLAGFLDAVVLDPVVFEPVVLDPFESGLASLPLELVLLFEAGFDLPEAGFFFSSLSSSFLSLLSSFALLLDAGLDLLAVLFELEAGLAVLLLVELGLDAGLADAAVS